MDTEELRHPVLKSGSPQNRIYYRTDGPICSLNNISQNVSVCDRHRLSDYYSIQSQDIGHAEL